MVEGRRKDEWSRVSSLMALQANLKRDPAKRSQPYRPADFDPTTPKLKANIRDMIAMFVPQKK